jgi:xylulokinase
MKYVIGVDLGTSAVKVLLVNQRGQVCQEASKEYPLIQDRPGFSEQNPEEWVEKTVEAIQELVDTAGIGADDIEGISYSGQMHGLVLLNKNSKLIRHAILWNDTRTTKQCQEIEKTLGDDLLRITKNPALEGFTLPKLLWVKEHEPEVYAEADVFLLPKDYLRFRMTGQIHTEYSDAAGTLLLDISKNKWSSEICQAFEIKESLCPPLVKSHHCVGSLLPDVAQRTHLKETTKIFAGGADNACGAIGSGILSSGKVLCSIGTSGVVLAYEDDKELDFKGKVHFFNHGKENAFYSMGVTLSAGYSLNWFKNTFAEQESFEQLLEGVAQVPIGAHGLIFTPYLAGERTPHGDAVIRGSFIGIDGSHKREDFVQAVMEGITFSLNESMDIFREAGRSFDSVISIGGGAKSDHWLQMQANIFNTKIIKLESEQGPGLGAAMLAVVGVGWYESLEECSAVFIKEIKKFYPQQESVLQYKKLFSIYQKVYPRTKNVNEELAAFRQG